MCFERIMDNPRHSKSYIKYNHVVISIIANQVDDINAFHIIQQPRQSYGIIGMSSAIQPYLLETEDANFVFNPFGEVFEVTRLNGRGVLGAFKRPIFASKKENGVDYFLNFIVGLRLDPVRSLLLNPYTKGVSQPIFDGLCFVT